MRTESENIEISEMLFPNVKEKVEDILNKYPKRNIKEGEVVGRFAPSPTGYLHIGGVFASYIPKKLVKQYGGSFILRIEDTDKKREIKEAFKPILEGLEYFDISVDEGVVSEDEQNGEYGPYIQSERRDIYAVFAKDLVAKGKAYPCFASEEELEEIRGKQKELGVPIGYYGDWAKWKNVSFDDIKEALESGKKFVIRLNSNGDGSQRFQYTDLIKGKKDLVKNFMDSVLLKSDGLPTYHFAHPIDDTLMDITVVTRGEEWFASVPLHFEIFEALGFDVKPYAHISPLMKIDEGNRRKLSKRKDPEADVRYYMSKGYPGEGVMEYITNIANSNFYDWRISNPDASYLDFEFKLEKMNKSGALFDIVKMEGVCRDFVASLSAQEVYERSLNWAEIYDEDIFKILSENKEKCIEIFNIEREGEKVRKDIAKWEDIREQLDIFFLYDQMDMPDISNPDKDEIVKKFLDTYDEGDSVDRWFEKIKDIGNDLGYTSDYRAFNEDPSKYKGKVGDVAMILRVLTCKKERTPDLYQIMKVLGKEELKRRLVI